MRLPFARVHITNQSVASAYLLAATRRMVKLLALVSPGMARVSLASQYAGAFPRWAYVTLQWRVRSSVRSRVPLRLRQPYDWLYRS
jgi:hypothetical protein